VQALDNLPLKDRDPKGPLRIPIIEKSKEGSVIAHGKVESGLVRVGDKIMISPSGYPAQVGSILDHKNDSVMFARPGENVSIKLIHIDEESMINKGDVITSRDSPMPVATAIEADIKLFKLLDHKQVFTKGYTCVMHLHTIVVDCTVTELILLQEKDKYSGKEE
jgi:peptide chain release factor subunit 3